MKTKKLILTVLSSLVLISCGNNNIHSSIIKSPNEEGGLGAGHSEDQVEKQDPTLLKTFLGKIAKIKKYSYEVTVNISGSENHFVDYYTENAWYEENDNKEKSFGYAQTKDDHYMFKYYLSEDEKEVYPSIYEYESGVNIEKMKDLYSPTSLANFSMLSGVLNTFDAISISTNRFAITSTDVNSVFQYMTTYGSAIINYMTAVYIDIVNYDENLFTCTIECGQYGNIVSTYTPLETTKIDFVNDLVLSGELTGVDEFDDTRAFFELTKTDNYILDGIYVESQTGSVREAPYTIYCNKNYFYFDFRDERYNDFGYVFVPKNTEITYQQVKEDQSIEYITQCLTYDACYGFSMINGQLTFDEFIGPVENENMKYLEVDALPSVGQEGILYITNNTEGVKMVYEWTIVDQETNTYGFKEYSSWYDCIGDFYFTNVTATFYFSGTPLVDIAPKYLEKDYSQEDTYYSTDNGIMMSLATSIFKYGFQQTDTWLDYVRQANLKIIKEGDTITGGIVGLTVANSASGTTTLDKISYRVRDFSKGYVDYVDTFLEGIIGA